MLGIQILNGNESRDSQEAEERIKNYLGFPIHTTNEALQMSDPSPRNNKREWQVYSRNRRCQKQMGQASPNGIWPAIVTKAITKGQQQPNVDLNKARNGHNDNNVLMEGPSKQNEAEKQMGQASSNDIWPAIVTKAFTKGQQQHNVDLNKARNGHSGSNVLMEGPSKKNETEKVTTDNYIVNNVQLEEAEAQWNMAKEMGATCGSQQGKIIDKIRAMEERDRKEAERLGNRVGTP